MGRKAEASEYLQKVVAYNPAYIKFLEDLETDSKDFASDLANSRKDFWVSIVLSFAFSQW